LSAFGHDHSDSSTFFPKKPYEFGSLISRYASTDANDDIAIR